MKLLKSLIIFYITLSILTNLSLSLSTVAASESKNNILKENNQITLERIKRKGITNSYSYSNIVKDFNDSKCLEKLVKDKFSQKDINAYKLLDKDILGKEKNYRQKRLRIGLMLLCIYQTNKDINLSSENVDKSIKNIIDNVNDVYQFKLLGTKSKLNQKCQATVDGIKKICTVGTFCSQDNKCILGFKQKDHSCQYNYECDRGLKCDETFKCVESAKYYADDLYKATVEHFLKIKFVNLLDDIVTKKDIEDKIDLNSDLVNTKIESLGKMLLSISVALKNNSPENVYSNKVLESASDIYKFNFSGNQLVIKQENCVESAENGDEKSICMPGTFCKSGTKNICELGFKKKGNTCTYTSECDKDLRCENKSCVDGKKLSKDKIPLVEKMEKRLSEQMNSKSELGPTLVRHKSEIGSFYNLKAQSIIQNKNTEEQNKVRDELLEFILGREKLNLEVIDTNKFNGQFFVQKDEGFISLKKDAPYEDTSNHELMHYVDYLLGLKKKNLQFTSNLKFENFLSYQLLDSKTDYIDYQDIILTNLIESFNLKHYREGYKNDKNIICEIPTNLMQQKNLKLNNLYDITKEYLTDYANELKKMTNNKLSAVADYILNRIK